MAAVKSTIPDNISEEYYQISADILSSFPKYRYPVDLFRLREELAQLQPYSRKGTRFTNEQLEEIKQLSDAGNLFVSRSDHPIYSEHIVKQLDLVLVDANLKESEVADICLRAMGMRLEAFAEQPVRPVFDLLYKDVMVLTEYVWQDRHRAKQFMRRLYTTHSLVNVTLNTLSAGMWLLLETSGDNLKRRDFDRGVLAIILHDLGMAKVPPFILSKTTPLKGEERDKIILHTLAGARIMQRLELAFDEMRQATMEHHERLDGSGYPQKLKGEAISKFGRLVAVADSFAAMITDRPYAKRKQPSEAAQELAADKNRYDQRFSGALHVAYVTDVFGQQRKPGAPSLLVPANA